MISIEKHTHTHNDKGPAASFSLVSVKLLKGRIVLNQRIRINCMIDRFIKMDVAKCLFCFPIKWINFIVHDLSRFRYVVFVFWFVLFFFSESLVDIERTIISYWREYGNFIKSELCVYIILRVANWVYRRNYEKSENSRST